MADEGFPVDDEEGLLGPHLAAKCSVGSSPQLQGLVATGSERQHLAFLRNLAKGEGGEADYFKGMVAKASGFDGS